MIFTPLPPTSFLAIGIAIAIENISVRGTENEYPGIHPPLPQSPGIKSLG